MPTPAYEAFTLAVEDGIAHVTLDRPDRGNPFDATFCDELLRIAARIDEDDAVRCVLITASGRSSASAPTCASSPSTRSSRAAS